MHDQDHRSGGGFWLHVVTDTAWHLQAPGEGRGRNETGVRSLAQTKREYMSQDLDLIDRPIAGARLPMGPLNVAVVRATGAVGVELI